MALPEQQPETFKYFVYWIYNGTLEGYFRPRAAKPRMEQLETMIRELEADHEEKARDYYWEVENEGYESDKADLEKMKKDIMLAKRARSYTGYQDFPLDAAITLFILADALQISGLKDQIVTRIILIYTKGNIADYAHDF